HASALESGGFFYGHPLDWIASALEINVRVKQKSRFSRSDPSSVVAVFVRVAHVPSDARSPCARGNSTWHITCLYIAARSACRSALPITAIAFTTPACAHFRMFDPTRSNASHPGDRSLRAPSGV